MKKILILALASSLFSFQPTHSGIYGHYDRSSFIGNPTTLGNGIVIGLIGAYLAKDAKENNKKKKQRWIGTALALSGAAMMYLGLPRK